MECHLHPGDARSSGNGIGHVAGVKLTVLDLDRAHQPCGGRRRIRTYWERHVEPFCNRYRAIGLWRIAEALVPPSGPIFAVRTGLAIRLSNALS